MPRVGLVFLDELGWDFGDHPGKAWRARHAVDGPLLPISLAPPPILVAVASKTGSPVWCGAWMRMAGRLVVATAPDAVDEETRGRFPGATWVEGADDAGVSRALSEASRLTSDASWRWLAPERAPSPVSGAPTVGPWIEVEWSPVHGVAALASPLCAPDGQPALLLPGCGARLELLTGLRVPVPGLGPAPAGSHLTFAAAASGEAWTCGVETGPGAAVPVFDAFGRAIGVDPWQRVAWVGDRCRFGWCVPTAEGLAHWCINAHEWPCGHAKDIWSIEDNDPLWVQLAPDASACLSVYEHDALITPGAPVRWRDLGTLAVAERVRGAPWALLYQQDPAVTSFHGDPLDPDDEAGRGRHATVTLGPCAAARYCVGLEAPTYRLIGETVTRLGGPANEWVVYDDAHRERQRHPGRLLGGWDRWVVVLEGELLARIDLFTGERTPLGSPGRPFTDVVPIAGTARVLLVQAPETRDATTAWIRAV